MKYYVLFAVMLITMSTAFGAWNDSLLSYWSFDDAYTNSTNATSNGVNVSGFWQGTAPVSTTCIVRECRYFTAGTSFLNITRSLMLSTANNTYTMTAWIYPTSASSMVFAGTQDSGGSNGVNFFTDTTPKLFTNKAGVINLDYAYTYVNKWSHLVFIQNQTGMYWYINATLVASNTNTANFGTSSLVYGAIGRRALAGSAPSSDQQYTGYIDEIGFYQRGWTELEINQSFNNKLGYNPYLDSPPSSVTNFTLTARDGWNLSTILNFSVVINGTEYNTTNGTIYTPYLTNDTRLFDILFSSYTYNNKTYANTNISTALQGNLFSVIPRYIYVYIQNYLNTTTLTSTLTTDLVTNLSTTDNPLYLSVESLFSSNDSVMNLTKQYYIVDLTYKHAQKNYNFTVSRGTTTSTFVLLDPNQFYISFFQQGVAKVTQGTVTDTGLINNSYAFNDTTIIVIQDELAEGYVIAKFGQSLANNNWTQYYEYVNDLATHVDEEIEILQVADWTGYIQVLDLSNAPIKDATVRAQYTYSQIGNWTSAKLLGQRLTNDVGKTFFFGDSRTSVLFTIYKDGYSPVNMLITIGDESFDINNPLKVYLTKSDSQTQGRTWFYMQSSFVNRSIDLNGTLVALGADRVQIQTDYREALGLSPKDITYLCDVYDRCPITLQSGVDYNLTSSSDIALSVYIDNTLWATYTIDFDTSTKHRVLQFAGLDPTYINGLLIMLILMITLIVGSLFNNMQAGIATFYVMIILAGMISTAFLWISVIITLYFVFRILQKVISE
jgi:hypothetical protein